MTDKPTKRRFIPQRRKGAKRDMIKFFFGLLCVIAAALPVPPAAADQRIVIGGAQSLTPLADKFSARFRDRHPGVKIEIRRSNSNFAVQATLAGEVHIGLVTRHLSPAESSLLYAERIGQDAVTILSHPDNAVANLSLDQLRDIYQGKITEWRDVGGGTSGIVPLTREPGSALYAIFIDTLFGRDSRAQPKAFVLRANKEKVLRTIKRVRGSVGYGIVRVEEAHAEGVTVLAVNRFMPTADKLQNENYPFTRPHLLVTKDAPRGIIREWVSGFAEFRRQAADSRNS
jgi:phosphate transport system substrate-binding protein